tara:strand:- start:543 stop:710 length:168 start_codon:yes stop_codon:yes gene_type:complete
MKELFVKYGDLGDIAAAAGSGVKKLSMGIIYINEYVPRVRVGESLWRGAKWRRCQ